MSFYDGYNFCFKGKARVSCHTNWITAECDQGILEYYRWWYWQAKHALLMKPRFPAHISVVRGEEEGITKGWWKKGYDIEDVCFEYSNQIFLRSTHVWIPVRSQRLHELRHELGLPKNPIMPFHITVGRLKPEDIV